MKIKILTILTISSSVILVACGGGGTSGSGGSTATPIPTRPVQDMTTTNNANSATTPMNFVSPLSNGQQIGYLVNRPVGEQAQKIQQAINYTNQLRAEAKLPPLKVDEALSAYAQVRASEIEKVFAHKRPDGTGIGNLGENIAGGYATASQTVLEQWKNSSGHYRNMLDSRYTKIGIGMVYIPNSKYGYYWVQIFGWDDSTSPEPYAFTSNSHVNSKPLQQIIVNGVTLNIPQQQGAWQTIQEKGYTAEVNGYQSMRFGAVKRNNTHDVSVFYQGLQTHEQAMPTTGTAQYQGQAVVVQDGQMKTNVSANFNVDYGKKTLNGTLSQNNKTLYNLNANIQGSAFTSPNNAKVQTQGAFFGSKAEELGGVFKDTQSDTKGAFGAVKK